jgi:hypothetical protein
MKRTFWKQVAIATVILNIFTTAPAFAQSSAAQVSTAFAGSAANGAAEAEELTVAETRTPDGRTQIYAALGDRVYSIDSDTGTMELLRPEAAAVITAGAPTFSPGGGAYSSAVTVTLRTSTPLATIYFTTNGTTPTTGSSVYRGPIGVSSNATIKAIAIAKGLAASPVSTAVFTVPSLTWPAANSSLGTYSRSNFFPPNVMSDIPVPQAVDTHMIGPEWPMTPVYRVASVVGPTGQNLTSLCLVYKTDGTKIALQCNQGSFPTGTSLISILASDTISSVVGVFRLNVTN